MTTWHFVAPCEHLSRHGDYVTTRVDDKPILVRNHQGTIRAYLNVCAHRHSLLTSEPRGRSDKLVCQYHGWEYAPDGVPCRVPLAQCFAPVVPGAERLRTFPVMTREGRTFISLDTDRSS